VYALVPLENEKRCKHENVYCCISNCSWDGEENQRGWYAGMGIKMTTVWMGGNADKI